MSLGETSSSQSIPPPLFSQEQYEELVKHLRKESTLEVKSYMTGIVAFSTLSSEDWLLDTDSTNHMTLDLRNLIDINSNFFDVWLPNGNSSQVWHIGSFALNSRQKLKDVLHVPDFKFNLISVSKLIKDLGCCVIFVLDFAILQDHNNRMILGIGKEETDLYLL